jgi:DinB superfamily
MIGGAPLESEYLTGLPTETTDLHPVIASARERIATATGDLLDVEDAALEQTWPWRGEALDVRYGFYHAYERLEVATCAVMRALTEAGTIHAPGARRAAPATAARWDLHARLLPLDDSELDRDPGGGEWTLRQTLAHIINAQRAYGHFTAWWLLQRASDPFPEVIPDAVGDDFPDESTEGHGSLPVIRARLDDLLDLETARMAALDDHDLAARARWSGAWVDVGFRMGRWSSHMREHTIQVDKTLVMIGWTPREVDRLSGVILGAWGRLEATVFGLPAVALDRPGTDGPSPAAIIDEVSALVAKLAPSVLASARD